MVRWRSWRFLKRQGAFIFALSIFHLSGNKKGRQRAILFIEIIALTRPISWITPTLV